MTAAVTICLLACNKSNQEHPASIIGKWNETELHVSQTSNGVTKDTTLKADAFSSADYAIFDTDLSAVFFRGPGNPPFGGASLDWIRFIKYRYQISGATLTLTRTDLPTGQASDMPAIKTETIIQLDNKNLILHSSCINGSDSVSTDAYFVRK
ncbi:MAG: hypothetical protein JWM28_2326 [Chitinophagaceae bacterium]|nr:hypothetical protein [Chitinophagaceae bacterium]